MERHGCARASAWGAGLGLLSLLIVVGLGLWIWSQMIPAAGSLETPQGAIDRAQRELEAQERALQPAPPAATSPASATAPTDR